jgi:hypothetical protein
MYAAVMDKSPVGLPLPDAKAPVGIDAPEAKEDRGEKIEAEEVVEVTKEDAEYLQKKAWDVYQKCKKLIEAPEKETK